MPVVKAYLSDTLSSPSLVYQHYNVQGLVTCGMYVSFAECDSKNCHKVYTNVLFPAVNSLNLNK